MKKTIDTILFFSIIVIAIGMLYSFYLALYPFKTIEFAKLPIPILNQDKKIKQGDAILQDIDFCRYTDVPALISVVFTDSISYHTQEIVTAGKIHCGHVINATVIVPDNLPPAKYHLEISATFKVNPLRLITVKWYTEDFWVISK